MGLYLQMTTWLCNYSGTISCRQGRALPVAKCNDFHSNHQVHLFSTDIFPIIIFITYSLVSVVYNVAISIHHSHIELFISTLLRRLYSTSVFLYVLRSTRARCQSNIPYWLSISQPSCRGLWRWRKGFLRSQCSVFSFRETPLLFFLYYPWASCLYKKPFHNSIPQTKVRGQVLLKFVFIYSTSSLCCCITVSRSMVRVTLRLLPVN